MKIARRTLLLGLMPAALRVRAEESDEIWDVLTRLASALSENDAGEFLRSFDRGMPGYATLSANVNGLVNQTDVQSSMEVVTDEGDTGTRKVEVDWILQVTRQQAAGGTVTRHERVRCRFMRQGKRWKIVAFEPVSFLAPP